ncbi:MAG: hypothetical protein LBG84_10825 [Treponema sp.]|jgi:hypothetical protein|nr:hypothetical protein [Treponema sp.]
MKPPSLKRSSRVRGKLFFFAPLFWAFLSAGCDQEPLFWNISQEVAPIKPIIGGAPSRIVSLAAPGLEPALYVSNGDVWEFDLNVLPAARRMSSQPGGRIKTLAAAVSGSEGYLFSLDWEGNLKRNKRTSSGWAGWTLITKDSGLQQIFGAEDYLFAGAADGNGYRLLSMAANGASLTSIKNNCGLLMGAAEAGGNYFLGLMGDGVYVTPTPAAAISVGVVSGSEGRIIGLVPLFAGGIGAAATGAAALRAPENTGGECAILSFTSGGALDFSQTIGTDFSGAMANWEGQNGEKLLLLGRHDGGYREFHLDPRTLYTPGTEGALSVEQGSRYNSTLAKYAVTSLICAPRPSTYPAPLNGVYTGFNVDGRPIIFASTSMNGFWSYRYRSRDGFSQWNGEDNGD